ncbi:MAG: C4-type zinc ribbon domain-containing protein [Kineosporiaceae bacterium]
MVTAAPQDQWRLLDVADADVRLAQLAHRRRSLPEHAEIERLTSAVRVADDVAAAARAALGDAQRAQAKAEADVEQVRQRAARNQARLDAGQGSAKDLQALQHELESLASRQAALEEVELEAMEAVEAAQARLAEVGGELTGVQADLAAARERLAAATADLDDQIAAVTAERASAAAGVPADLVALYEKVREQVGGTGAARLSQRRCEGCRLELTPVEISRFRTAEPEAVLRCEECRRILVRTAESGL